MSKRKRKPIPPMTEGDTLRFWGLVKKTDGCWLWLGTRTAGAVPRERRYGSFRCGSDYLGAHRVSWVLAHGQIPGDMLVLHNCDNPPCVNPAHLYLGTELDNARDRDSRGRSNLATGARSGAIKHPEKLPRGEKHPFHKLTNEEVLAIRAEQDSGRVQTEVAKQFGVCQTLISQIWRRKVWKHL